MNIVKVVIEGELPECCGECYLNNGTGAGGGHGKPLVSWVECMVTGNEHRWEDDSPSRPDWCPLTTEEELLNKTMSPFRKWESEEE